jgi:8-oxo-dGTP diphosphatase
MAAEDSLGGYAMKLEGLVCATVTLLIRKGAAEDEVYLAVKTAKIGVGCINGIGGGLEGGESIDQCAIRETEEETGVVVRPQDLERRALIYCNNYNKRGEKFVCKLYVSVTRCFAGEPVLRPSSGLVDGKWYPLSRVPIKRMMFGDRVWATQVLEGKRIMGEIFYAPDMNSFERPPRINQATEYRLNRSWHP